jgi:hypothetical protein
MKDLALGAFGAVAIIVLYFNRELVREFLWLTFDFLRGLFHGRD